MRSTTAISIALASCCLPAAAQVHTEPDHLGDTMEYAVPLGTALLSLVHKDTRGLEQLGVTLALSQGTTEVVKRVARKPGRL